MAHIDKTRNVRDDYDDAFNQHVFAQAGKQLTSAELKKLRESAVSPESASLRALKELAQAGKQFTPAEREALRKHTKY